MKAAVVFYRSFLQVFLGHLYFYDSEGNMNEKCFQGKFEG